MGLKAQIEGDIKKAMLDRNQLELLALRSIKSAILLAETEKGSVGELSADGEMKVLIKAAKQRKESIETYRETGRNDLADKEQAELEVIERYLPDKMSPEELEKEISDLIAKEGASGMSDMGKIMGLATKVLAGKADGKEISAIVKSKLSES